MESLDPLDFLGEGVDQVTLIGLISRKREFYLKEAAELSRGFKDVLKLEEYMKDQARKLIKKVEKGKTDFRGFRKEAIDMTFVSSMAAAMIGSRDQGTIERIWPQAVGRFCTHLPEFLRQAKIFLETLPPENFAEDWEFYDDEYPDLDSNQNLRTLVISGAAALKSQLTNKPKSKMSRSEISYLRDQERAARAVKKNPLPQRIATWAGMLHRLVRFVANPTYNFFQLSNFDVNKREGMSQMRRQATIDDRTCTDCLYYDDLGWQPIGQLPLPGQDCVCMDNCRCVVHYR